MTLLLVSIFSNATMALCTHDYKFVHCFRKICKDLIDKLSKHSNIVNAGVIDLARTFHKLR